MSNRTTSTYLLAIVAILLTATGCTSASRRTNSKAPAVSVEVASTTPNSIPATTPIETSSFEPQPVAVPTGRGMPVYTGPKFKKTILRGYQDDKGRLFGPQIVFEQVEEGHFNVAAMDNPETAYIPPENLYAPYSVASPAAVLASAQSEPAPRALPIDYNDPRELIPTSLMRESEDAAAAQKLAQASGRRAVFDRDLGYMLVPITDGK